MPEQVTSWKAEDGQLFDTIEEAIEHDAKKVLRQKLMILMSHNGEVNGFVLDKLVSRWHDVRQYIDEYVAAISIDSGPE